MSSVLKVSCRTFLAVALCLSSVLNAPAQEPNRPDSSQRPDEVIRIDTELVQTEVMVFDRDGRFVNHLKPEQFELKLNGNQQSLSFFERITSGSMAEASQLAAARNLSSKKISKSVETPNSSDRGRVMFFFLDDLHLSPASLARARKALQSFVDNQMNPADQVAIVSTSGQIGFLQQLTDNPAVLHTAIARLKNKQSRDPWTGKTQISEYTASQVIDYGNRELYAYLLESVKVEQQMGPGNRHGDHGLAASYSAAPYLRNRLRQVNSQSRITTESSLDALKNLMLSSAALPGRKLVFFLSDGFTINERRAGALEALERVTAAAVRSGVVVYTMDLRGTFTLGSGIDATSNDYTDASARRMGVVLGEVTATQEPLKLIADETGGRAFLNSNSIGDGILQAINETSNYYLLAWRPASREQREGKLQLAVSIKDRPDLKVRIRTNTFGPSAAAASATAKTKSAKEPKPAPAPAPNEELLSALGDLYPNRTIPVSVSAGFQRAANADLLLKLSFQIDSRALALDPADKNSKAELDVMGAAIDDRGLVYSFKQVVKVPAENASGQPPLLWNQQLNVKPGLYQVRVAVRERATGKTGSAMQWIEVPETATAEFGLSSLFLGERKEDASQSGGAQQIRVDVDHRFARNSVLRFQTYVHNPTRASGEPDVWIQPHVLRNRQPIKTGPVAKVPVNGDVTNLSYWSEIALQDLMPGAYVLQLTATDRVGNRSAVQRINFSVE
ncbi:MAG TPA: VWA domain-containing protein [Pyrinomonadaceae bacterium]|nr:VWA domain-containing protein [Pyrinomonadaceae bacterium]